MSATVVEQKNARAWATTVGTVTLTVRLRLISRQFKLFTPSAIDAEQNRRRGDTMAIYRQQVHRRVFGHTARILILLMYFTSGTADGTASAISAALITVFN